MAIVLEQDGFNFPVQKALYAILNGKLKALDGSTVVPICDAIEKDQPAPYVSIMEVEAQKSYSTKTRAGSELAINLMCISEELTFKESASIASQVIALVTKQNLDLSSDNKKAIIVKVLNNRSFKMQDGRTRGNALQFYILAMDALP